MILKVFIILFLIYFMLLHVVIVVQQQDIHEKDDRIKVLERLLK